MEAKATKERVIIMGAGGRDFHNFNMLYRNNPCFKVAAFTATQIPFIEKRTYPHALAGDQYPAGIPIHPEAELESLILKHGATRVVFSYSDISHEQVMHKASLCISRGADFILPGPEKTMLSSSVPVISVCAVRTGCGKSIVTRKLASIFQKKGIKVSVIRHPMAYCDFAPVKKFASVEDIDRGVCTIEEREEFEHLAVRGITVFAGVDYERVLRQAENEAEVIIWDGGNNDFPFVRPDFEVVLLDAMRPGHEKTFYPGEVNLRRANLAIITKTNDAREIDVKGIRKSIKEENPGAAILEASSVFEAEDFGAIKGKRALVIEDGPTITHGGMPYGAGMSSSIGKVSEFVDPRPFAKGSIKDIFVKFPHIGPVLPAMGYSESQVKELEETISLVPADVVIIATPIDLRRIIDIERPTVRVSYDFDIDLSGPVQSFLERLANKHGK